MLIERCSFVRRWRLLAAALLCFSVVAVVLVSYQTGGNVITQTSLPQSTKANLIDGQQRRESELERSFTTKYSNSILKMCSHSGDSNYYHTPVQSLDSLHVPVFPDADLLRRVFCTTSTLQFLVAGLCVDTPPSANSMLESKGAVALPLAPISISAKSVYGKAYRWQGTLLTATRRSISAASANTIERSVDSCSANGDDGVAFVMTLTRPFISAPLGTETADVDEYADYPLAKSTRWATAMRRQIGPDAFYGLLVGPEIIILSVKRLTFDDHNLATAHSSSVAMPTVRNVNTNSSQLTGVVSYAFTASLAAPGDYFLLVEHTSFNHGGFHDRDRYGGMYEPKLVLLGGGGKSSKRGRAGSVKPSLQRLKLFHHTEITEAQSAPDDFTESLLAEKIAAQMRTDRPHLVGRVARLHTLHIPSHPNVTRSSSALPYCTLSWVQAQPATRACHERNKAVLGGRYVAVAPHTPHIPFVVRGWNADQVHPTSGLSYAWAPFHCRLQHFVETPTESENADKRRHQQHRHDQHVVPPPPVPPHLSTSSSSSSSDTVLSNRSRLATCLAARRLRLAVIGDSQMRTIFNTIASALHLRAAVVDKRNYKYVEVVEGATKESEAADVASNSDDMREKSAGNHQRHVSASVEFIWDPLLLNVSSLSCIGRRRRCLFQMDAQRNAAPRGALNVTSHPADEENDARVGKKRSSSKAEALLDEGLVTKELEEDDNVVVEAHNDEQHHYGPRSPLGVHPLHHIHPLVRRALLGRLVFEEDNYTETSIKNKEARENSGADVFIIGFGGWFGMHVWTMEEFEVHMEDMVDAFSHITSVRRQQRNRSSDSSNAGDPLIIFVGTPAWPSYVPWEGHRRNTNTRLGVMMQIARAAFLAAARAGRLTVAVLPYFEISYPMRQLRFSEHDIHYDQSAVPYTVVDYIGTLLCSTTDGTRDSQR